MEYFYEINLFGGTIVKAWFDFDLQAKIDYLRGNHPACHFVRSIDDLSINYHLIVFFKLLEVKKSSV